MWTNGFKIEEEDVETKMYNIGETIEECGNVEILESTNQSLTLKLGRITKDSEIFLTISSIEMLELEKSLGDHEESIIATIETDKGEFYSNEWTRTIKQTLENIEIVQTCNIPENIRLKDQDNLIYTFKITNSGKNMASVYIEDYLQQGETVNKIYYTKDGKTTEVEVTDNGNIFVGEFIDMEPGDVVNFVIDTTVEKELVLNQTLSNYAELRWNTKNLISNTITHSVEKAEQDKTEEDYRKEDEERKKENNNNPNENETGGDNTTNNNQTNNNQTNNNQTNNDENNMNGTNSNGQQTKTYSISGIAYYDKNKNGKLDDTENMASGIKVQLLNTDTNKFVKTSSGNTLIIETNNEGKYNFNDIPEGNYIVVFSYDMETYEPTIYEANGAGDAKNSNAIEKTIDVDGLTGTRAITDVISLTQNRININLGLVEKDIYDLSLSKTVSKLTAITSQGKEVKEFDGADLGKIEINAKYLAGSTVIIEYKINVTNEGEVPGYVKSIVDYKPADLNFDSSLNKDWYQSGDNLYTTSLADTIIAPGETKTVTLILTKTMTETNTGLVNNQAEIAEDTNSLGLSDRDSASGNKQKSEDDMGSANVIINVKTGAAISYVTFTISIIVLLITISYLIGKEITKKKIKL